MMMRNLSILASAALVMVAAAWSAGAAEVSKYKIIELYNPCNESDNDARWGAAAEAECEQYLRGFTDALILTGAVGPDKGICLPEQIRDDEVRWAYMYWVNQHYGEREKPAAGGVMETLKTRFPCN